MPNEYKIITIQRSRKPTLRFIGRLVAFSSTNRRHGKWKQFTIYQTKSGHYVAAVDRLDQWQPECNDHDATPCRKIQDIQDFYGADLDVMTTIDGKFD